MQACCFASRNLSLLSRSCCRRRRRRRHHCLVIISAQFYCSNSRYNGNWGIYCYIQTQIIEYIKKGSFVGHHIRLFGDGLVSFAAVPYYVTQRSFPQTLKCGEAFRDDS